MNIFIEPEFTEFYKKFLIVLADIGASGGIEHHWRPAQKYLQLIGFEPDEREFSNLQKKENGRTKYLNTGLYMEKVPLEYYLTAKQQNSSIFKPNREFLNSFPEAERFDIVKNVKIEMDTLDNQFKIHNIKDTDFIKIDSQGSELFILKGSVNTLHDHVFGVEVEVGFSQMYQDQPLFSDVDIFMRKQGFWVFDIQTAHWKRTLGKDCHKKRGQLIFGNALYLRTLESFSKVLDSIQSEEGKKGKILKALSICFLYGYFDYAMEIFDKKAAHFNEVEQQVIKRWIKKSVRFSSKIPHFKIRRKIARVFYSLWEFVRPTDNGWATTDRKIGNI